MKKQQSVSDFVISSIADADLRSKYQNLPKAEDSGNDGVAISTIAKKNISELNCSEMAAVAEAIERGLNGDATIADAELLAASA